MMNDVINRLKTNRVAIVDGLHQMGYNSLANQVDADLNALEYPVMDKVQAMATLVHRIDDTKFLVPSGDERQRHVFIAKNGRGSCWFASHSVPCSSKQPCGHIQAARLHLEMTAAVN